MKLFNTILLLMIVQYNYCQTPIDLHYYTSNIGSNFYTTNFNELGNGKNGWTYQGVMCKVYPKSYKNDLNYQPVYRYYANGQGRHFFTSNFDELGNGKDAWRYEGIAFYVKKEKTSDNVELYRYYNTKTYKHFYTIYYDLYRDGSNSNFRYEGVLGYVIGDKTLSSKKKKDLLSTTSDENFLPSATLADGTNSFDTESELYVFKDGIKLWINRKKFTNEYFLKFDSEPARYYKEQYDAAFGGYMRTKNGVYHVNDKGYFKKKNANKSNSENNCDCEIDIDNIKKPSTFDVGTIKTKNGQKWDYKDTKSGYVIHCSFCNPKYHKSFQGLLEEIIELCKKKNGCNK